MKTIKVSSLISQLEKIKADKGDIDVVMVNHGPSIDTDFIAIDEVNVSHIHPDDVANEDCGVMGLEGIIEECVPCIVLS